MTDVNRRNFVQTLARIKNYILESKGYLNGVSVVGIDGPDCSGKSTLCRALISSFKTEALIFPIHFDDFLNSPETISKSELNIVDRFRHDYFDWDAMIELVSSIKSLPKTKSQKLIVLVEGLFLFENSRRHEFDYKIRLDIDQKTVLERAIKRDVGTLGDSEWVRDHYLNECIPAQKRYVRSANPAKHVDLYIRVEEEGKDVWFIEEFSSSV